MVRILPMGSARATRSRLPPGAWGASWPWFVVEPVQIELYFAVVLEADEGASAICWLSEHIAEKRRAPGAGGVVTESR
jgi:hypothetical protein